jgi:hypothetical protein
MNCPKNVEFNSKINLKKISASSWFYYKDSYTAYFYHNAINILVLYAIAIYLPQLFKFKFLHFLLFSLL